MVEIKLKISAIVWGEIIIGCPAERPIAILRDLKKTLHEQVENLTIKNLRVDIVADDEESHD